MPDSRDSPFVDAPSQGWGTRATPKGLSPESGIPHQAGRIRLANSLGVEMRSVLLVGALNVIDQPIPEKVHHIQRERGDRAALVFRLYVQDLLCQIVVLLFVGKR